MVNRVLTQDGESASNGDVVANGFCHGKLKQSFRASRHSSYFVTTLRLYFPVKTAHISPFTKINVRVADVVRKMPPTHNQSRPDRIVATKKPQHGDEGEVMPKTYGQEIEAAQISMKAYLPPAHSTSE